MQLFFMLIIAHFIADFMLQINDIGSKKYGLNRYMLAHVVIISVATLLPLLAFQHSLSRIFIGTTWIFLSHLTIDIIRSYANRRLHLTPDTHAFWVSLGIDQILHVTALYLVVITI